MKKLIYTSVILVLVTLTSVAQDQYQQAMGSAMSLWGSGQSNEASAAFERISQAEKGQWLPCYYVALINVFDSFREKDKTILTQKLEKSERFIKIASERSANKAELFCIKGLINTVKLIQDPINNGQTLSPTIIASYKQAIELEPGNPRPLYLLAQFQINSASRIGQDCKSFYKSIEKAIELFNTFNAKDPFYPSWGKEQALAILKTIK